MIDLSQISQIFSFAVGVAGAAWGVFQWHSASVRKTYAAERDFNHLKNNLLQVSAELAEIAELNEQFLKTEQDAHSSIARIEADIESIDRTAIELKATLRELDSKLNFVISNRSGNLSRPPGSPPESLG